MNLTATKFADGPIYHPWTPLEEIEAHLDNLRRDFDRLIARMAICPHCGSVLAAAHPGVSRYKGPDGVILCCVGCRAFMKGTLARVRETPQPAKKGS